MNWLDRTLGIACATLLVAGCSDDGFAQPADTDVAGTTTGVATSTATADAGDETFGDESGNNDAGNDTGDPGTTGDGGTTSPPDETTGGGAEMVCVAEEDCLLINDCCACTAVHVEQDVRECDLECEMTMCDALGIPDIGLVCAEGRCELEPRNCSDAFITCDGIPPRCPEGTLPEITPEGDCWTGACIPIEACDGVPSCEFCAEGEVCVNDEAGLGTFVHCEPLPDACEGEADCDCAGELCVEPFDTCAAAEGVLQCSCIAC